MLVTSESSLVGVECFFQLAEEGSKTRLTVAAVQQSDSGRFTCQALNAAGSKSTSCMLIVAPAPSPGNLVIV